MSVRKGSKIIASAGLINISAVDDVLVDGISVVTDKVAEIDLTGKQDKLSSANAGTNVTITEVGGVVKINATGSGGTTDFDDLTNRPSYNGTVMTHSTNIPEVKTAIWDNKSTVSASAIGTSEDEVQYITIDGVEKKLAGGGSAGGYHPDLFDYKWADHQLNDVQWLRADTFSWQSGSVYQAAYKHLRNDMYNWYSWENNGTTIYTKKAYPEVGEKAYSNSALTTEVGEITSVTDTLDITVEKITVNNVVYDSVSGGSIAPTTETVGGITVHYIPAEDGHKIVTSFDENEVVDIYTATGVAWYYIIDYGNRRFKLPRSKHEHYGDRHVVGNGKTLGFTDGISNDYGFANATSNYARAGLSNNTAGHNVGESYGIGGPSQKLVGITTDATKSGIISTPIQDTDQYKYLYFYVGQFTQTALENTAGLNAELFNEKQDVLTGVSGGGDYVVSWQIPTAENNYTWYRKYKSGWVEQGGQTPGETQSTAVTITLPITMKDGNYYVGITTNAISNGYVFRATDRTTTTFKINIDTWTSGANPTSTKVWMVSGMSA